MSNPYETILGKRLIFSGDYQVCSRVAQDMGLSKQCFRFIDPDHFSKLYGLDKGTLVLFWCGKPPQSLFRQYGKFLAHLKIYDASIIFIDR